MDGTVISTTSKGYERNGAVAYTITAARPAWVPNDATLNLVGNVIVDGISYPITKPTVTYSNAAVW